METKIVISKLHKFNKRWKRKKAHRAVALMNRVINSNEFREAVKAFDFTDRRYQKDPKGPIEEIMDNLKIYEILKQGNEQYGNREDDYKWTLHLKLGKFLRQVGRREKELIITQNWFMRRSTDIELAAHWFHEYSHIFGFRHDYEETEERPNSIPYGLGTIVKDVYKELNG